MQHLTTTFSWNNIERIFQGNIHESVGCMNCGREPNQPKVLIIWGTLFLCKFKSSCFAEWDWSVCVIWDGSKMHIVCVCVCAHARVHVCLWRSASYQFNLRKMKQVCRCIRVFVVYYVGAADGRLSGTIVVLLQPRTRCWKYCSKQSST
jgi:hypothetical protein